MEEKQLIARYAPVFALHPEERYNPSTADYFLSVGEVRLRSSGNNALSGSDNRSFDQVAVPPGSLKPGDLTELVRRNPDQNLQLNVGPEFWGGIRAEDLDRVPLYATLKRVYKPGSTDQIEAIEINYTFLFNYNGAYEILCFEVGQHVADWEHVTMRLDPNGELRAVYYSTHRNFEGDWVAADKVPIRDGRPLVYIARFAHGCYPRPGVHVRIFGFANDVCSDDGVLWKPREVRYIPFQDQSTRSRGTKIYKPPRNPENFSRDNNVVVNDENGEWLDYRGFWGTVRTPQLQIWFVNSEDPTTWGWFRRAFCPCLPGPPLVFK